MGTPNYDAQQRITNGVLIMHGSSGDASQVLAPSMIGPLTVPGGALDPARYYLIFPDILGAGKSTKPSDGLRAKFPRYGYGDLVDLEYRLVTEHFRIQRLRLVMGISMGGMHAWMWGIRYPGHDGRHRCRSRRCRRRSTGATCCGGGFSRMRSATIPNGRAATTNRNRAAS